MQVGRITAVLHAPAAGEQQLSLLRFLKPERVLGGRQVRHHWVVFCFLPVVAEAARLVIASMFELQDMTWAWPRHIHQHTTEQYA
jgi:hypothetical protein